jgi:hypothetical protein
VESLVVKVDVHYKPLKASELLLLLRHDDKRTEVERMIMSNDEMGRVAPPYVLEVP